MIKQHTSIARGSRPDVAADSRALCHTPELDCRELLEQPIFCFTTDIDWASEAAIQATWQLFDCYDIPLTPFITHESAALRARFATPELKAKVGLHPNFLPGSTHGNTVPEVIDHVQNLWPQARGFRSHSFFDTSHVTAEMVRRGLSYDSNVCLWLQPNGVPLTHASGLIRFPVFWEDDVHFGHDYPFDFDLLRAHFDQPGLKIINIHPIHVALNVPNNEFYQKNKHLNGSADPEQWHNAAHRGVGTRTLLTAMLEHVRALGCQAHYLADVFARVTHPQRPARHPRHATNPPHAHQDGDSTIVNEYLSAPVETRAALVRSNYDMRDKDQLYVTSRDFHLRELEIDFLAEHLRPGKILDLGCGNGYTIVSLARRIAAEYLGLDFSAKMLEGAASLVQHFAADLKSVPTFQQADVRHLAFADSMFDCVLSERCVLNLPSRDDQWRTIREVHRVLKAGGQYLLVEGTEDGLERLNDLRAKMGLEPIPSVSAENASSLKFREAELETVLAPLFVIAKKHYFGLYYLISRVVHPLLAAPENPKFDSKINAIARQLSGVLPFDAELGHVVGYHLIAKK
jgi:ubiquinone/menaquinone biosynthesis C-methylase UbiE